MTDSSQQPKDQVRGLPALKTAISVLNVVKEATSNTPASPAVASVAALLAVIRDTMANKEDFVDLGIYCVEICKALKRGMDGKELDKLSESMREAIEELERIVAEIHEKVKKRSGRHSVSRFFRSSDDKDAIVGWNAKLGRILHVFNTQLAVNTNAMMADIHQNMSKNCQDAGSRDGLTQSSVPGELPPPPPRAFFGRQELIEEIIRCVEGHTPIALIGAGGIGKTSIALAALHDDRIKHHFGENRRFILCDELLASHNQFLRRLSEVIGAEIENPRDLATLRQFLASRKILIVLDNAESILDQERPGARDIFNDVKELAQSEKICLLITSRISIVPPECKTFRIPILTIDAARDTFYGIYTYGGRSTSIDKVLGQLEFHPLSIALLATVAQQNTWDTDRLIEEWARRRTAVLAPNLSRSLAETIELSLTSPKFRKLDVSAREFLEVVAFFPQGVNEKNVRLQYPTISNAREILDEFCVLSLTYRRDGFVTMLAPLRDYLRPNNPASSPLLSTAKEFYFSRLSCIYPGKPGFEEARWITSEDVNVEYLLDVFTTIDQNSEIVWDACDGFMDQMYWHKPRVVTLGPKIEALPDNHPSKAECLLDLARLFTSVRNFVGCKRLLNHALELWRKQGNDFRIAETLRTLSNTNQRMGFCEEGIQQAKEASGIFERLGYPVEQADCLVVLVWLLMGDKQLDAAEEMALRALDLLPKEGEQIRVHDCHRVLGQIYQRKGETVKAIRHFKIAVGIASTVNSAEHLFSIHFNLAYIFTDQDRFSDAQTHVEHAKTFAAIKTYNRARASELQAKLWYRQDMFGKAKSEALAALDAFEKLGSGDADTVRQLLQDIDARWPRQPGHSLPTNRTTVHGMNQ